MWKNIEYNEYIFSEWVVSIGIRIVEKAKTRQKIIEATEYLIKRKGFVKISSKEISKECDVSQGSIFLHFNTKYGLLMTILESNIESLENDLKQQCTADCSQELLIKNFLEVLNSYEDILARIYRDHSYLENDLKKKVDNLEIFMKNLIFDNYKKNSKETLGIVDSFIAIDAFLSQIKDYLMSKETFTSSNSVLRQRRGRILKLYKILFAS
ncbi:putative HTH-type transcriptional regulator TtgW [Candidatus Izimaplasma bacterium HR1]|jgi:AcrR family transcriptional regulator|uniref:TetR/AcrR family transcriptional regulator n=1 Tax=Candidatus Izimoplasma sp. HR1 TaxID=1541959 RepID=UPI0004F7707F|nr:putative HTH-type transcriptional regulator TtgW [Candidatus Izimaplasma bacterium HR1]